MNPLKVAEQVASLKGLFKGKGELLILANACVAQRDALIQQTLPSMLARAHISPLHLLPVQLSRQATQAGTTFLRWRRVDRTAMGVAQWQALLLVPTTPLAVVPTLYQLERQRILLNAQISLTHALAQLARSTADKLAHAERIYHQRRECVAREVP
ncbi:DUF3158 family protein [Pseudomonas batumici]|uniref:DUF3158 family protein n=1 Tax=Pseudomonas batumici TaxID=226910 RepID=UPI0030CCD262